MNNIRMIAILVIAATCVGAKVPTRGEAFNKTNAKTNEMDVCELTEKKIREILPEGNTKYIKLPAVTKGTQAYITEQDVTSFMPKLGHWIENKRTDDSSLKEYEVYFRQLGFPWRATPKEEDDSE